MKLLGRHTPHAPRRQSGTESLLVSSACVCAEQCVSVVRAHGWQPQSTNTTAHNEHLSLPSCLLIFFPSKPTPRASVPNTQAFMTGQGSGIPDCPVLGTGARYRLGNGGPSGAMHNSTGFGLALARSAAHAPRPWEGGSRGGVVKGVPAA